MMEYFDLRVDCECNRPSSLVTVFSGCYQFNGDLNQWDVAEVTTMKGCKSIRVLESDLT
jgi:surface protein